MKLKVAILTLFICFSSYAQKDDLKQLDIMLNNYEYPFKVDFINLDIQQQELKMGYMDVTPDNYNGKNILLFHGKNFNGAYWETTAKALLKEGFRVIMPDQIGFGNLQNQRIFNIHFSS